ncbi:MAG: hypothetical protein JWL91_399 [Sphingomonas bacterium]|nr:hypothetical protein [Sphingomonas bacterium]MDB5688523.1 hypothetical protein [Sphingomonas bacterium]
MTGPRRGDPHRMLMQAVRERAERDGIARIVANSSEAWASATFRGARHNLSLQLEGDGGDDRATKLAAALAIMEFRLPGHLVADIALTARKTYADGMAVEIEALTLEDG